MAFCHIALLMNLSWDTGKQWLSLKGSKLLNSPDLRQTPAGRHAFPRLLLHFAGQQLPTLRLFHIHRRLHQMSCIARSARALEAGTQQQLSPLRASG